ncbi:hypothetical protein XELAEV_18038484mg [Xenopus laevis]|uniref:Uncharacterized protein n=1 Tax=Xenopus laevis TaxID=8355 RepID=A0A974H7H9_XENLA|nr:hypothetical protein XELAEV_18038484mg [Xenopus laevis]
MSAFRLLGEPCIPFLWSLAACRPGICSLRDGEKRNAGSTMWLKGASVYETIFEMGREGLLVELQWQEGKQKAIRLRKHEHCLAAR